MIQNIILHAKGSRRFAVIFLGAVTLVLSPADLAAQGQPFRTDPCSPLLFGGSALFFLAWSWLTPSYVTGAEPQPIRS
jgi:hypothetical protein